MSNYKKYNAVLITFITIFVALVLIAGATILIGLLFVTEIYQAFIFDTIGTTVLYGAGLVLCLFFLYFIAIILFINPSKLKKNIVLRWAIGGITVLILTTFLINQGYVFMVGHVQDIEDYENRKWKVEDLQVLDIYGNDSYIIETQNGDLYLEWQLVPIHKGETYRITYLEHSGYILKMEELGE
nr:hypothetical protein [Lysinibacillus timonensis]